MVMEKRKGRVLGFLLNSDLPSYFGGGDDDGDADGQMETSRLVKQVASKAMTTLTTDRDRIYSQPFACVNF
jgi:hypothetical protein